MKGIFISFEGTEGSGKTSVIKQVEKYFTAKGYHVLVTREPGGIRISEMIRDILLDKSHIEMDPKTEALLFAASRRQHLVEKILPSLERGELILCDRYIDSSLIYQGVARNLGIEEVFTINKFAIDSNMPDRTIFVDVRPEVGLKRVFKTPNREVNRLDLEEVEFHKKIYQGYIDLMKRFPNRIKRIDGEKSIEEVAKLAIQSIEEIL
ncbi:MAG: dTMP kinase [Firmicutes bacterium]|nr:dTMP kinase [Bacillota bacterium]